MGCGASKGVDVVYNTSTNRSLDERLLDAAAASDVGLCYTLVALHARVGVKDKQGNTALHWLCTQGAKVKDIQSFFNLGVFSEVDFSEKNHKGLTPFLCAANAGNDAIIFYLCSALPILPLLETDSQGNAVLHLAVLSGRPKVVGFLLENICLSGLAIVRNTNGETPLAIAERLLAEQQDDNPEKILESDDVKEYNSDALSAIIALLRSHVFIPGSRKDLIRPSASQRGSLFSRPATSAGVRGELLGELKKS